MNLTTDAQIISAMKRHGGSFVSRLAEAAAYADPDNLAIIKKAFPAIWETYSKRVQGQNAAAAALLEQKPTMDKK